MHNLISSAGKFIKAAEFNGEGKILKILGEPEMVVASNPKYAIQEGPMKGKTVRYKFLDGPSERWHESKAQRFARCLEPFKDGDTVRISRSGLGADTQYEAVMATNVTDIPFGN